MTQKELRTLIREEIKRVLKENTLNEGTQFKDLKKDDLFSIFGDNGQLWVKINSRAARFVQNLGTKTAPYKGRKGEINVFPPTHSVTPFKNKK